MTTTSLSAEFWLSEAICMRETASYFRGLVRLSIQQGRVAKDRRWNAQYRAMADDIRLYRGQARLCRRREHEALAEFGRRIGDVKDQASAWRLVQRHQQAIDHSAGFRP